MPVCPEKLATAYHEAGHAVVALALGRLVQRVSVQPNQLRLGICEMRKESFGSAKDAAETAMLILLGGIAAEARHTGQYDWEAASKDLRGVRMMIERRVTGARQAERLERRLLDKAEYLLDQRGAWTAVERIAAELLRSTTISGRAAKHLFDQAIKHSQD